MVKEDDCRWQIKPYVKDVGTYLVDRFGNEKHPEELEQAITLIANAVPEIREDIMTFAQQLEQRGRQQGLQQERQKIAKKMLAKSADIQFIKETTHLSDEEIARLHRCLDWTVTHRLCKAPLGLFGFLFFGK